MQKQLFLICFFMLGCGANAFAQVAETDSLWKFSFDTSKSPEEQKSARHAYFRHQKQSNREAFQKRPQQVTLIESKSWLDEALPKQDSIVDALLYLVQKDTLAGYEEKKEAVRLLAKTKSPKVYKCLMENVHFLLTLGDYDDTDYWFVKQEVSGNWLLFPEIIQVMKRKNLDGWPEELITVTLLLDKTFQDPPLLVAILNLYAQKEQNELFSKNKKLVVELLQTMHQ